MAASNPDVAQDAYVSRPVGDVSAEELSGAFRSTAPVPAHTYRLSGCSGVVMQRDVEASTPAGKAGDAIAKAHAELLRDRGFQFDRADFQPQKTPEWLKWIGEAFQAIAPLLKYVFWIGVALIAALVLYALVREVLRLRMPTARPKTAQAEVFPEWRPDAAAARDLLAAADLLAAEGRYAEAAHLILLRSVEDIERRRPRSVRPALTTREIAGLSALPSAARPAFAKIGAVVERSLFGGAPVEAADYAACRGDYEAFALPAGWA